MKLWGFQQCCCCKGAWMSTGAMRPATWAVLTLDNGGLSVVLNPLVACWEQAAVHSPLTTDTLKHALPLDNWILPPGKSLFSPVRSPATRGPDRNSPIINVSCGKRESELKLRAKHCWLVGQFNTVVQMFQTLLKGFAWHLIQLSMVPKRLVTVSLPAGQSSNLSCEMA